MYVGPLHEGLDAARLSAPAAERAAEGLLVVSSLWGALLLADRIPSYRLHICSRLVGMDRLEPTWRTVLPDVLAAAATPHGVILDLRSPGYQAVGMPTGLGDRTVSLRVARAGADGGNVGAVIAKRSRGEAARLLLESDGLADDPDAIADVLADRWPVRLEPPAAVGHVLDVDPLGGGLIGFPTAAMSSRACSMSRYC